MLKHSFWSFLYSIYPIQPEDTPGCGRCCMVVGFHNYLCNQCLSSLMLWVRSLLSDKVCQWLAAGWWYSPGTSVSSTNKTDHHDIAEILLKVALNTTTITANPIGNDMNNNLISMWDCQVKLCLNTKLKQLWGQILLEY